MALQKKRAAPEDAARVFSGIIALISRDTISQDFVVAYSIMVFAAAIARVSFDGVNNAVFNPLNDASMIGFAVLWAGAALVIPIEEDNHTGCRFDIIIRPLPTLPEPLDTVDTAGELGNDTGVDIAAFVCAPADDAGAPLHAAAEAVP